jgi:transposase-like protein
MAPVNRELWDKEKKIRAVRSVRAGQMWYKRAAKQFNVPKGTLERYIKDNAKSLEELIQVNLGRRPILPDHIDSELVKYLLY